MSDCKHKAYATPISAKKAARAAGLRGKFTDIERCSACSRWRVKGDLV